MRKAAHHCIKHDLLGSRIKTGKKKGKKKQSEVSEIIKRIPDWREAKHIHIEPLAGLTNTNYSVIVNGEKYVLRVKGPNTTRLSINRGHEFEILTIVSEAGIGTPVAYYLLPEGHLVTGYLSGHHLTLEEYRTPENILRIVQRVQQLHAQPPVEELFSPFRRVESYAYQAQSMRVSLSDHFNKLLDRMSAIEQEQAQDTFSWRRFCHNDLFCVNVLENGEIRFNDWEFAGVGGIDFDLAILTYAYDSFDNLSLDLQEFMLACYFGGVSDKHWKRLAGMK